VGQVFGKGGCCSSVDYRIEQQRFPEVTDYVKPSRWRAARVADMPINEVQILRFGLRRSNANLQAANRGS